MIYTLVEFTADGVPAVEPFEAPDADVALARALQASEAPVFELWSHDQLIHRVET